MRPSVLGLAALLVAGGAAWAWLRGPALPTEAEGQAWLREFAARLIAPETWGARGPEALARFPGLGPWSGGECVLSWSTRTPSAPIVLDQRLELGRLRADEPCAAAQFGLLGTTLRPSPGVTPGALAAWFTERFGPPDVERDESLSGTIASTWQIEDGIFARMEEHGQEHAPFSLLFMRSYGAPTHLADAAASERWMARTVALVSGPELPAARGPAAVSLVGAGLRPESLGETCPILFEDNLLDKDPIASGQTLLLDPVDGAPCDQARFSSLSLRIWQRDPITAAALVSRLGARLGAPTLSRDADRNTVAYRWTTPAGTTVELREDLSPLGRHWLLLRVSA